MKAITLLTIGTAIVPNYLAGQAEDDYVNFIRQIQTQQNANGEFVEVIQDTFVDPEGEDQSALGIPKGGALFQLWTTDTIGNQSWLLDTATVGSSRPQAHITIVAADSHAGVPRTRADIPFSVTTEIFGLQSPGENIPEELTQVLSSHFLEVPELPVGEFNLVTDSIINKNQTETQPEVFTAIVPGEGKEPFEAKGVEHFTVKTISDSSEREVIANAQIKIFPLTTGELGNFDESPTVSSLPDTIDIVVDDAYPGSEIILRVKVNAEAPDGDPSKSSIDALTRSIRITDSEDLNIAFSELDQINYSNGDQVTFCLISESIFDTLILAEQMVTIDSDLFIRGSVNTLD